MRERKQKEGLDRKMVDERRQQTELD